MRQKRLSQFTAKDRASRFRRRCHRAGVFGMMLHCYRYAWAERAKTGGMSARQGFAVRRQFFLPGVLVLPVLINGGGHAPQPMAVFAGFQQVGRGEKLGAIQIGRASCRERV